MPVLAVLAVAVPAFTLVPAAAGHVDSPTVTAFHAFVGDPMFGLDTADGNLFGVLPDERTAMASTTKLMTLDLTLHAVEDGVVSLDDDVTVDAFAASLEPPNSVMADVNNVTLEPGEVVSLETLIRGMMYPSGNDAAWAIAFYVANAYGVDQNGDAIVDGLDFVDMMNQHALDLGLTDTQFTSPNGWDDPTNANPAPSDLLHYTTARELSEIIDHGLNAHPHFGEVIGFSGTYTDTTQGGASGTKTYSWSWGFNYPGWEGHKGGGTQNCNGLPNRFCLAISANRIGRRVVQSFMQGPGGSEITDMFDYGFAQIFHPDPRGSSANVGSALRDSLTCFASNRCLSAVLPDTGPVTVVSWAPDLDSSSIGVLDQKALPGSGQKDNGKGKALDGDVALARLPSGAVIVADRTGNQVELSRWVMDGSGALSLLSSGKKAGPARAVVLQPVAADMFLTATITPDRSLEVTSWRLQGTGLSELETYRDKSRNYSEVAIAEPATTDVFTGHRAMTAAIAPNARVHDVWGVDETTGAISRIGEFVQSGDIDRVAITSFFVDTFDGELFPPVYYAEASRTNGALAIRFYRIDSTGAPVLAGGLGTGLSVDEDGIAALGTGGVLSASRAPDGSIELVAWEARRNADDMISVDRVSQHTAFPAGSLDLARVPSAHAEGDYVTAVTDSPGGLLRLRAYRSGDRPYP